VTLLASPRLTVASARSALTRRLPLIARSVPIRAGHCAADRPAAGGIEANQVHGTVAELYLFFNRALPAQATDHGSAAPAAR